MALHRPHGDESARSDIGARQNGADMLRLLKARQWLFQVAFRWQVTQLFAVVLLPIAFAIAGIAWSDLKPIVAAAAAVVAIADAAFFDRSYRRAIKSAARAAEEFDTQLLRMPWSSLAAGARPDPEAIQAAAEKFDAWKDERGLKDWYPPSVDRAPLFLARIICQRSNLTYDSALRREFTRNLAILVAAIAAVIGLFGIVTSSTMSDVFLSAFVPPAPIIIWALREYFRQRDAAEANDVIQRESERLLQAAIGGACSADDCASQARQLQSALFARRSTNPLLLPFLYKWRRPRLERNMDAGAEHWLREAGYPPEAGTKD